jgi:hypothetical protein
MIYWLILFFGIFNEKFDGWWNAIVANLRFSGLFLDRYGLISVFFLVFSFGKLRG